MSNVELPPLTHEKITLFHIILNLTSTRLHDPYFHDSAELSDYERRGMARDIRAQARLVYRHPMKLIVYVVVGCIFGPIALVYLFLWIPTIYHLLRGGAYDKDHAFYLIFGILGWILVIYKVRKHLRITKGLKTLALRFPGSVGTNRNLQFLAWLDAHWPATSPLDEIETIHDALLGGRWDLQSSYRDRPLLVRVCDLTSIKNSTPWRRVSIYLSAPRKGITNNQLPDNIKADFDKLGYHAFASPAGIFMCHNGRSLEALNPERIARLLDLAYRTIHERNGQ